MGICQFHHATESFKRPLGSVYPQHTNKELRSYLKRIVLPFIAGHDIKQSAYVMWSLMRKKDDNHNINHLVSVMVNAL